MLLCFGMWGSFCKEDDNTGSSRDAGTDGVDVGTGAAPDTFWGSYCAWVMTCDSGQYGTAQECVDAESVVIDSGFVRDEAVAAWIACYSELDCTTTNDECFGEALEAVTDDPTSIPEFNECMEKQAECQTDASGGFTDDNCHMLVIMYEHNYEYFAECFDQACSEVAACLLAAWDDN